MQQKRTICNMKKNRFYLSAVTIAILMAGCSNDDIAQEGTKPDAETNGLTTFVSAPPAQTARHTRTALLQREKGQPGEFQWEYNWGSVIEHIWVKKDGTFIKNTNSSILDYVHSAKAAFYFDGVFTENSYQVYYTGNESTEADKVTIPSNIRVDQGGDKTLGNLGDCGVATAVRNSEGVFEFELEHKAAYLCLIPRAKEVGQPNNFNLYGLEITSDNYIAGTYGFSNAGLSTTPLSDGSKTMNVEITHWINPRETVQEERRKIYLAIAPGPHNLTIKYYVGEYTNENRVMTVVKRVSADFAANTITDITSDLTNPELRQCSGEFYLWDAQEHIYKGYENEFTPDHNYLEDDHQPSMGSPRYANLVGFPTNASHSCKDCPNVNELTWYVKHGDPHWERETGSVLQNSLYSGGVWLKKRSKIPSFSAEVGADGIDHRGKSEDFSMQNTSIRQGRPSASEINDYFFLPALGCLEGGAADFRLWGAGEYGGYWSSSSRYGYYDVYLFSFDPNGVNVGGARCNVDGYPIGKFE